MEHEFYMQRCLELAVKGSGNVSPNPMVGCVIVCEDRIIGEGYHQKIGEAHAEVNAVKDVFEKYGDKAAELLKNATAYVSLEPCAHFGKTPPCADLLIKHQIKKVVIGNADPFESVNGKGIEKLKNAGIEVVSGILDDKCKLVNRRFFTRIKAHRPYFILKWAQTADGFFAPTDQAQQWISGVEAKVLTHQWRSEEDAILVGKNTVLADNPQLNTREVMGKSPIRLIIDKNLAIPSNYHIFNDAAKTIVFNEVKTEVVNNIHYVQMEDMHFYLPQKIAYQLYLMDIQSVIIEGGANILTQFIAANLWDEARIFTSKAIWGEDVKAPIINGRITEEISVGCDKLQVLMH
ncbi:bifunctional diaminohydroxyphosphoribosylaminopyrimidine deaminase/5-amino-6-(5-phosphoribosylamino)uracil reductase RibD [Pedobacter sp. SL55]|uniref:bifunctional diaminohydroxyphosphoribosylaminopyrimidine deaminase/5-amino-6-(5-phosphoribosylamino)uracil reductase RibD n=1 Tax=Pedobacter sp. SL55 TaxID=2995161 RepID=UPI002270EAE1|nr:bifunctional diaminohydroxyphosphoribosylaminopyrimidine deaminase/5-amino-6-(5-phosphoribosylamino)uracil reductase RibD [Pedobacter sp. SL55]WAC40233.1 bifunctional diaminohydroxyphosphoribosylaminopyrimidine deaminase/5-amino-6-(5-phosphoribosylamino)uracil reductase RibD [Pedobacter sp. SL55]